MTHWHTFLLFIGYVAQIRPEVNAQLQIRHRLRVFSVRNSLDFRMKNATKSDNGTVAQLVLLNDYVSCNSTLRTTDLNQWNTVYFDCDCFTTPGGYNLSVYDLSNDAIFVDSTRFEIKRSVFELLLPKKHTTLSGPITMSLGKLSSKICSTEKLSNSVFLSVQHRYNHQTNFHQLKVINFDQKLLQISSKALRCDVFDRAGLYRLQIFSRTPNHDESTSAGLSPEHLLVTSNVMSVSWYPNYQLKLRTDGINPGCRQYLTVSFVGPKCPIGRDRVRLYGILQTRTNSVARPTRLKYLEEQHIHRNATHVRFLCNQFDSIYMGFCFKLLTILDDGHVHSQATQCVPTDKRTKIRDGAWSSWSSWTTCSNQCGQGVQHRHRQCNNPTPSAYAGADCLGPAVQTNNCTETRLCKVEKTDIYPTLTNWTCLCGCDIDVRLHSVTNRLLLLGKCDEDAKWTIRVPEAHDIKIQFYADLPRYEEAQWMVQIRDGSDVLLFDSTQSNTDRLLFVSDSLVNIEYEVLQPNSTLNQPVVLQYDVIEFTTPNRFDPDGLRHWLWTRPLPLLISILFGAATLFMLICCVLTPLSVYCLYAHTKRKIQVQFQRLPSSHSIGEGRAQDNGGVIEDEYCQLMPQPGVQSTSRHHHSQRCETTTTRVRSSAAPTEDNMMLSTTTESTRLSGMSVKSTQKQQVSPPTNPQVPPKPIPTKRSVGVQLWGIGVSSDSPGPPQSGQLTRRGSIGSRGTTPRGRGTNQQSSSLSLAGTEQDFEYDYYEPAMPGSYLLPPRESLIDIDQIIGDSELLTTSSANGGPPTTTRSVSVSTDSARSHNNKSAQSSR